MCQGMQCAFEGYEGECNLTTEEIKAILERFEREPCPDIASKEDEKEYWEWIEQVEDLLDELRMQKEKAVIDLLDKAMKEI